MFYDSIRIRSVVFEEIGEYINFVMFTSGKIHNKESRHFWVLMVHTLELDEGEARRHLNGSVVLYSDLQPACRSHSGSKTLESEDV